MSEQHNVPPKIQKNTVPPISPVVDGQETVNSTGLHCLYNTVHRPGGSGWAYVAG